MAASMGAIDTMGMMGSMGDMEASMNLVTHKMHKSMKDSEGAAEDVEKQGNNQSNEDEEPIERFAAMPPAAAPVEPEFLIPPPPTITEPVESNVYDPRFYSYGTSYRAYNDRLTGQPRFYYDDIDVQRRPNYVTRNNIDFTDYGTKTGPMEPQQFTNQNNVRTLAGKTFLNNELHFRTDMQERLMRKAHKNAWQQRQAPIHNQFM